MDIEKALAKQRQRSGTQVPLTSNDVKGEKGFQPVLPSPEGSIGEVVDKVAKQRMKVSPTGDTPIGRVNDIIGY